MARTTSNSNRTAINDNGYTPARRVRRQNAQVPAPASSNASNSGDTNPVDLADDIPEFKKLQQDFEVFIEVLTTPEAFLHSLKTKYNDISAIYLTFSIFKIGGLNPFIDYLPSTLKIVAISWVGHNAIDGAKLRDRGIILTNIGDASAKDVADIALFLSISVFRNTSYLEHSLRSNNGDITQAREVLGGESIDPVTKEPLPPTDPYRKNLAKFLTIGGKELNSPFGKTVGIVGLGGIGKEIAKRLNVIGLKIKYTKRKPLTEIEQEELGFPTEFVSNFNELLPQIDLLVLAVPQSPETTHLINEETIKLVKPGLRIVNIGRGAAIDEDVLLKALDDGIVNSVGLDVFKNEPHIDPRFVNRWDVTILPHMGSFTVDNFRISNATLIKNIENVLLQGGEGLFPVN
ncbi:Adenosylhomocysteinase [Wickerhamomyces ciferrii]|uniref:Adenosylhomocysteinase n=1 Tax=Wickerhamomyces ciferrii (strain ATCC 14091 / BCRC 22168 / CBS 111 / JCM 3599 / NBRC 0793 / NRRL Y-1031 F-60-10) TaxID=1206466 RepID=K0KCY2_WICCF|nr:Adenosylhomocysteinase [Wickerhamomyces ciferrii]CCH40751.1 Adenosylhomocysteinase [Wickerhamomyces ciferrii]